MAQEIEESSKSTQISLDKILFATDFSSTATKALSYAAAIAAAYNAELCMTHVINLEAFDLLESQSGRIMFEEARREATRKMARSLEQLPVAPQRRQTVVAEGVVAEALLDMIEKHQIDLAVMGTHGRRALRKLLLGSTVEEVFRMARCPVLTVGPHTAPYSADRSIQHVLYLVEFVPDTANAAGYAVSLADRYGAKLTVMNVREDSATAPTAAKSLTTEMDRWIQQHVDDSRSNLRGRVNFHLGFGPAAASIAEFGAKENVDIIVMSVRELDPVMAAHLPDTAYQLIGQARCPVLTVR